jgi:hypothetical protein
MTIRRRKISACLTDELTLMGIVTDGVGETTTDES